jgi:hypothetical protein
VGCFILASGVTVLGEIALIKQQDYLQKNRSSSRAHLAADYDPSRVKALHAEEKNPHKGEPAGGGDAG